MGKQVVALDCETFLIGPGTVAPKVVCVSFIDKETGHTLLLGNGDKQPSIEEAVKELLDDSNIILVGHNMKFDMGCLYFSYSSLQPLIWQAFQDQRITCTQIRERLLNLSSHGNLDNFILPDGSAKRIDYSLAGLVLHYTGEDRRQEKKGKDIWRLRYSELDGMRAEDYPQEARDYALKDAINTLEIYDLQEEREESPLGGPSSMRTQYFQTACDFALYLMTCRGMITNPDAIAGLQKMIDEELSYKKLDLLIDSGILVPAQPGRPHKRNPNKTTKPKPEKIDTKVLKEIVKVVSEEHDIEIKVTPAGAISTNEEVMARIAEFDPILAQYQHRQNLNKIRTTEIPRLSAGLVHPNFQILKRSGRTSSYAGKNPLYPAFNCQNVDYRVRHCFVPREGYVFCSVDYSAIELVSLAEKCKELFGYSKLQDIINEGKDPHAYLGAHLAFNLNEDFKQLFYSEYNIDEFNNLSSNKLTTENVYDLFMQFKTSDDPEDRAFFKHWRTFAKPTDLGYPGGLGPKTFVNFAKTTYGVEVTLNQAEVMRDIWHNLFPEMREYFEYISKSMADPHDPDSYIVLSPLGMYRAGATYCAACNGNAMQTPTAEGAKGAVFEVVKACSLGTALEGCYPVAFVHDEIIVEIPEDNLMHVRAGAISTLMIQAMSNIIKNTRIETEAVLMRFWSKEAEPVYDDQGRLTIWQP